MPFTGMLQKGMCVISNFFTEKTAKIGNKLPKPVKNQC